MKGYRGSPLKDRSGRGPTIASAGCGQCASESMVAKVKNEILTKTQTILPLPPQRRRLPSGARCWSGLCGPGKHPGEERRERAWHGFGSKFFVPWKQSYPQARGLGLPRSTAEPSPGIRQESRAFGLWDWRKAQRDGQNLLLQSPPRPARCGVLHLPNMPSLSKGTLGCSWLRDTRLGESAFLTPGGRGAPLPTGLL